MLVRMFLHVCILPFNVLCVLCALYVVLLTFGNRDKEYNCFQNSWEAV